MLVSSSLMAAAALGLNACAMRGASTSTPSGYRGEVTVTNQSGLRVCLVEPDSRVEAHPSIAREIAPGASATFVAERNLTHVQVLECETNRLLYGDPWAYLQDRQTHPEPLAGRITLLPPGSAAPAGGTGWQIPLEPIDGPTFVRHVAIAATARRDVPDGYTFLEDASLAADGLRLMREAVRRAGWTENFTTALLASDGWSPVTERRRGPLGWTDVVVARRLWAVFGGRYATGRCAVRGQELRQPWDGESEQGPTQLGGIGDVVQVPCALLDVLAAAPGAAHE
ncbi:MAG: hypothetical protein U0325_02320 [Polyangiales bacterium]